MAIAIALEFLNRSLYQPLLFIVAMILHLRLLPSALFDLYAQAATSGAVTLADRYGLLAAILEESLSDDERSALDRILWAICRGRVRVIDELSAIL